MLTRVAEPCHLEAVPGPEPALAPDYLLHAWVSWGPTRPTVVVFTLSTYLLHKVPTFYIHRYLPTLYIPYFFNPCQIILISCKGLQKAGQGKPVLQAEQCGEEGASGQALGSGVSGTSPGITGFFIAFMGPGSFKSSLCDSYELSVYIRFSRIAGGYVFKGVTMNRCCVVLDSNLGSSDYEEKAIS